MGETRRVSIRTHTVPPRREGSVSGEGVMNSHANRPLIVIIRSVRELVKYAHFNVYPAFSQFCRDGRL